MLSGFGVCRVSDHSLASSKPLKSFCQLSWSVVL